MIKAIRSLLVNWWIGRQLGKIHDKVWMDYVIKQGDSLVDSYVTHSRYGQGVIVKCYSTSVDGAWMFRVKYANNERLHGSKEIAHLLERNKTETVNAMIRKHYAKGGKPEDLFSKEKQL